jgi:putative membrane protein
MKVRDDEPHVPRLRKARVNGPLLPFFAASVAFTLPIPASAHVNGPTEPSWTAGWTFTPEILIGLLILAALYAAGLRRQRGRDNAGSPWRHVNFFCALAAWFIALQSPLDALAEHSFFLHQVQHLLLQTVAPMIFMLAAPQRLLAAGMPALLRRWMLAPILSSRALRGLFGFLVQPWIAALLLVASLYAWHWPPYHDRALLDEGVHYWMHTSMLAAGLLFYGCVFDPRPAPLGARYGVRMNVLWFTMTANMLLGAALALKDTALYGAYDQVGRLWDLSALQDERVGGLIMWIPGSAACVPAFLALLHIWNSQEARVDARRRRGIAPAAAASGTRNPRVAFWLASAAFIAFAGTLGVGLIATRHLF